MNTLKNEVGNKMTSVKEHKVNSVILDSGVKITLKKKTKKKW